MNVHRRDHHIVVVEDDADLRAALSLLLDDEGYEVRAARDGREALSLLAREPLPCLIFVDLMMPGMDGWTLIEAVGRDERLSPVPIAVITASGSLEIPLQARYVLRKPIQPAALMHAVMQSCSDGR